MVLSPILHMKNSEIELSHLLYNIYKVAKPDFKTCSASSICTLSIIGLEIGLINMRLELNVKFYVYFKALCYP